MDNHRKDKDCQIIDVGRRRDGGTKYWCLKHRADATAKYGKPSDKCRRAHIANPTPSQIVDVNTDMYPGGLGIWGAIHPIYDTTDHQMEQGIHVHARETSGERKIIDSTFRHVNLVHKGNKFKIDELDATYFMVSSIFGFSVKSMLCDKCGHSHLDKDWFAVHPHKVHLCSGCGRKFRDTERAIGNPVDVVRSETKMIPPLSTPARKKIKLSQKDYPGGIQIWGSNPAIIWSGNRIPESGIHIHAFKSATNMIREVDDTYSEVTIDGIKLREWHIRTYMAQLAMPHLKGRVSNLSCTCGADLFSGGSDSYTPRVIHTCNSCGEEVRSRTRLKKVIANPAVKAFELISRFAVNPVRKHESNLLPEAP